MQNHPRNLPSATEMMALGSYGKPVSLLMILAATIFASELFIMILLEYMPILAPYQEALFDAVLLTVIVFPILYFLSFKPLTTHIAVRQRAEDEKTVVITKLKEALAEVELLKRIMPICSSCKKIRDDEGYWHQVEAYFSTHSGAQFSHGICNECLKELYPEEYEEIK